MAKYKITYDREGCIGAFACMAAAEDFWADGKDGKADLVDATFNEETGLWERIIDEEALERNQEAAEACPVQVIEIKKIEE